MHNTDTQQNQIGDSKEFWTELFCDFEEPTPLAFGYDDHGEKQVCIDVESASLEFVIAAWAVVLARCSGEQQVIFGVRRTKGAEPKVVRLAVNEEGSVSDYLSDVKAQLHDQLEVYPVEQPTLNAWLQYHSDRVLLKSIVSLDSESKIILQGDRGYSKGTLSRVSGYLNSLVKNFLSENEALLHTVSHLSDAERKELLREWNPEPTDYPVTTVQAVFEKQAELNGSAVALVFGDLRITYQELNVQANRLAHHLIESGLKSGQTVAIFLERGPEQVISTLAILKAGAAYVPLDIEFPPERIDQMLEDAGPLFILTHSGAVGQLGNQESSRVLLLNEIGKEVAACSDSNPSVPCDSDALAYIMYTSGSTGRPKGVEVLHRGIIRLVCGVDYLPFGSDTVMLHIATVSFDATTFEMWGSLLHGGTCVMCPSRVPTLDLLGSLLEEHAVNTLLLTAAFFNLVVKEAPQVLRPVKYLLAGGEALSGWHVNEALNALPAIRLINAYGPTENSVISTTHTFEQGRFNPDVPIPIGRAIGNSSCYILDERMRPVPVGVPGELYVGGDGVARGYTHRPELTAERFLDDPFSPKPNARMYKTGDMVYWNQHGLIEFIGRVDNQVKLRGFRIELQEIDTVLASFDGVEQAVTLVYEDDVRGKWLAAYIKVADPEQFPLNKLFDYVGEKLPDYMVPAAFVPLAQWKMTTTGKLDRKSLPKPELSVPAATEFKKPETETQQTLSEIWQRLLQLERCGIEDNFFELGGDSLRGVHLLHEIQKYFDKELPLAILTRQPTIHGLATVIDGKSDAPSLDRYRSLQLIQQGDPDAVPLFLVHGGQGNVLVFGDLVHGLGPDKPVYAFQWSGWDGRRGDSSIQAMARAYKDELLSFYPEGPIQIGGYCVGALIAIEMASLLKQEGREITPPLVVWDSPNLESAHYFKGEPWDSAGTLERFNRMKEALEAIRIKTSVDPAHAPNFNYSIAGGLSGRIRTFPGVMWVMRSGKQFKQYLQMIPTRMKIATALTRGRPVPMEFREQYCRWTMIRAAKRHHSQPYPGHVLYFRSDCVVGRYFGLSGWWDDPFLGFEELCSGRFETYAIGGGHTDVLHIPEMCEMVKLVLQEAE